MGSKILVFGENVKDRFIYGKCPRLAPEGPFPVFVPTKTIKNDGCAGNVVKNLESLIPGVIINFISNYEPIIKTRYVDETSNYTLLRVDENDSVLLLDAHNGLNDILEQMSIYDAIVISDYNKGLLNKENIERILFYAWKLGIPSFVDTKKTLTSEFQKAFVIKINETEFQFNLQNKININDFYNNLIVTYGERGIYFKGTMYPANRIEVRDLSGAGDSALAGLVAKYLESKDLEQSIIFANKVAGVAVSKKGVVAVKLEEVV